MRTKGRYSQRELLPVLVNLIDAARAKGATLHRDNARAELRRVLAEENWNTIYILNNIGVTRSRHIAGLGHSVATKWLFRQWTKGIPDDPWVRDEEST